MSPHSKRYTGRAVAVSAGLSLTLVMSFVGVAGAEPTGAETSSAMYTGHVEVIDGDAADPEVLNGTVFDDLDQDSVHDDNEPGIADVTVSNGRDVVTTDADGAYSIPAFDNMTVFVTQPAGYQVPVDEYKIAQFSYNHLPEGSPDLEFGGIPATGPLPRAVNFPMAQAPGTAEAEQSCPIATDTQTYDMTQVRYARDGAVADLMARDDYADCGILLLGDNVGDDLSLYPALKDIYADANGPIRMAPGNHDMDYDTPDGDHQFDTFRNEVGPAYFSYDIGQAHIVVLDSIVYPLDGDSSYQERIDEKQLAWLEQDLAQVPEDKLVVVATHAPIVDHRGVIVDNAPELYDLLDGRSAVTIGGHTHMLEYLRPGDQRAEWAAAGVEELEHPQLIAGAVSGNWYSGALDEQGLPYAYMADGSRPGVLTVELDGNQFAERYTIRGESDDLQLALGVNTPHWRDWAAQALEWRDNGQQGDAPPLGDRNMVSAEDLAGDSWITANFFAGSTASQVEVSVDGGAPAQAEPAQPFTGEELRSGWEFSDPVAATRNLLSSGSVTRSNAHLWRLPVPSDLTPGTHSAEVTGTDAYGREFTDILRFTVVDERPAAEPAERKWAPKQETTDDPSKADPGELEAQVR